MSGRSVPLEIGTAIGAADEHHVQVRGLDLVDDLIGELTYTEVTLLAVTGRRPTPAEAKVVDAVLVSLLDHGLTPSALAARLTFWVAPEAIQGAVAAGLLGAGSVLLGSMEGCGRLLTDIAGDVAAGAVARDAVDTRLRAIVDAGERIPGLGHSLHRDGDPRARRLLGVARDQKVAAQHVEYLELVVERAAALTGKALPLNATGAAAALLLEVGVPWRLHRGFALMSRTAGLVAHVGEELESPITPAVRAALRAASRIEPEV
ncbi:citryl-CoA lyase [Streptosporangium carneum]|uniref:citrate synthase (unknown stereospecificity) n=1 Tax=Streptosporangium carneum TaxID=47481 RepID=A0A9W6I2H3_9ACTN|nr:citryl-CoA lyase [Streptosporangium carneum]GLK10488.1 citryl-CoA lyase [Streptosporangium carneum]